MLHEQTGRRGLTDLLRSTSYAVRGKLADAVRALLLVHSAENIVPAVRTIFCSDYVIALSLALVKYEC